MNINLSTQLDAVQTIAFQSECPTNGRAILVNANQLRNPQTDDRTRRIQGVDASHEDGFPARHRP